jgi:hypothetical protein
MCLIIGSMYSHTSAASSPMPVGEIENFADNWEFEGLY